MYKSNNIFEMFDDISKTFIKTFNDLEVIKNNSLKNSICDGIFNNSVTFKYDTKLDPEDKKKVIIDKLNYWTKLEQMYNHDAVVTFEFGKDEIFYFTWDKDRNGFVTVDPSGEKFLYDYKTENLIKIENKENFDGDKNNDMSEENNSESHNPAGVSSDVVDNTVPDETEENDVEEDDSIEKDFHLKDDKNLAFNLRNALRNSYIEFNEKNESCEEIFCPFNAAESFKNSIIDNAVYETEFDDENNPVQIKFDICWLIPNYEYATREYYDAIDDIYHNESENLDKFCELIKDKYNFSLGGWSVYLDENNAVNEIQFAFKF